MHTGAEIDLRAARLVQRLTLLLVRRQQAHQLALELADAPVDACQLRLHLILGRAASSLLVIADTCLEQRPLAHELAALVAQRFLLQLDLFRLLVKRLQLVLQVRERLLAVIERALLGVAGICLAAALVLQLCEVVSAAPALLLGSLTSSSLAMWSCSER